MSLGRAPSFDPHRHQYVLEIHHLALTQNKDGEPQWKNIFLWCCGIWSHICTTYWIFWFCIICISFFCTWWMIPGGFWRAHFQPCVLANSRNEFQSFYEFFWDISVENLAWPFIEGLHEIKLGLSDDFGSQRLWQIDKPHYFEELFYFTESCVGGGGGGGGGVNTPQLPSPLWISMQPANSKWWFHGMMVSRICGWTVSQWAPVERCLCVRLLYSLSFFSFFFFFCFPQEPLKLSVPGNNFILPRERAGIQGIRRHLACKSLFLSLTLCIAFYFPLFFSVSSPAHHCTNIQSRLFRSGFTLARSRSFLPRPAQPLIDQRFDISIPYCHWYITECSTGMHVMIISSIDKFILIHFD